MRGLLAALFICLLAGSAQAHVHKHHRRAAHHGAHFAGGLQKTSLSLPCRIARTRGGPCGCFASEFFFGHSVRDLWLASAWLAFPHVRPAARTAAVWPRHHVAAVVAVNGDGTVTVHDSWATHRVRMAGLVFVDPYGTRRSGI